MDGEFPKKINLLKQLKGVGDYTANAIASICFEVPSAVVDGNVYRFLSRYFGINKKIGTKKSYEDDYSTLVSVADVIVSSKATNLIIFDICD